jgi:hypothetical protein
MNIMDFCTGEKIKTWTWRKRLVRMLLLPFIIPIAAVACVVGWIALAPIVAAGKIYEHVKYGKDLGI